MEGNYIITSIEKLIGFEFRDGWKHSLLCCLIDMYSNKGKVDVGRRIFNRMPFFFDCSDQWLCTPNDALLLLFLLLWNAVSLHVACSILGLMGGKQIHGFAVRRMLNNDLSFCSASINTWNKHECTHKNAISWSSMKATYCDLDFAYLMEV